jgi:flavin-dependent dehydrogenase
VIPLVVVGAGPVGLTAAIAARLQGLACVVIDRREPPLDKACGEGIMPEGVRQLAELEVRPTMSHPFAGIRYIDGDHIAEARFGQPGLGVRRTALSDALLTRARELGVELSFGTSALSLSQRREHVRLSTTAGDLDTRLLVGADGLHSKVRELAGIAVRVSPLARYAARCHYRLRPWSPCVDVHWADDCEAYVTPVASDTVGIAVIRHGREVRFDEALAAFPELAARLAGAEVVSRLRGAGPFRQDVQRRHLGNVVLVGDAAGYVDALTGEGLTTGIRCARALADVAARGQPLAAYEDHYRRITRTYYAMTGMMLAIAQRPTLRRQVIGLLARAPALFDFMLTVNAQHVALS